MLRRTWLAGLGIAALAVAGVFAIYVVAAWSLSIAAPNVWFDANNRARIADDIQHTATQLAGQGRSRTEIAKVLVERVNQTSGYVAAVIDDNGKLIAGDASLAAAQVPLGLPIVIGKQGGPFPGPPPPGLQFGAAGPPPARESAGRGPGGARTTQHKPGAVIAAGNGPPMPPPDGDRVVRLGEFRGSIFGMHPPVSHNITFVRMPFTAIASPTSIVRIENASVIFGPSRDALSSIQALEQRIALGIAIVIFVLVWFLVVRMLASAQRPIERLRSGLLRLSHGDYARLEAFSAHDDATTELVDAYNAAAARVEGVSKQQTDLETKIRQFVADAGHELRTPLAVIMGYVQLLRESGQPYDAMARRVFAEIDDQGKRMSTLIAKLLLLTRLESQEPVDVKILDAADVATNVIDSFRPLANGATLKVEAQRDSFVQVSESELTEAIGNLIDNALKYAPGAAIEARVRSEDDVVLISISDTGPGMSPDVRARAFERFSRGEMGGSITGSGLGLAIVERAAKRAGGTVSLESTLGRGTTVQLRLPAWHHLSQN